MTDLSIPITGKRSEAPAGDSPCAKKCKTDPEEIPQEFLCSVCKEIMVEPGIFACGHSMCEHCQNRLKKRKCPQCQQRFDKFIPNIVLRQHLQQKYPEVYADQIRLQSNGWTVLHCDAIYKGHQSKVMSALDKHFPVKPDDCKRFLAEEKLNFSKLITFAAPEVSQWVDYENKHSAYTMVLQKNGRVFILEDLIILSKTTTLRIHQTLIF